MKIKAHIDNSAGEHHIALTTDDNVHSILIPPKPSGFGSSTNGGELLFLALATCYCNDIYREATKRNITWSESKWRSMAISVQRASMLKM